MNGETIQIVQIQDPKSFGPRFLASYVDKKVYTSGSTEHSTLFNVKLAISNLLSEIDREKGLSPDGNHYVIGRTDPGWIATFFDDLDNDSVVSRTDTSKSPDAFHAWAAKAVAYGKSKPGLTANIEQVPYGDFRDAFNGGMSPEEFARVSIDRMYAALHKDTRVF